MNRYYSLAVEERQADIYIFGDITSYPFEEGDVSSYALASEIQNLDVDVINVHINSYGGEVSEGLAIYNTLRQHTAKIKTYCDGFACSAASVVFMAGDERIMFPASLLMIHNAWQSTCGNAKDLRKAADDLEEMSKVAAGTYLGAVNISDEELQTMLEQETWITPENALTMGFATAIVNGDLSSRPSQNVRLAISKRLMQIPVAEQAENPKENIPRKLLNALWS